MHRRHRQRRPAPSPRPPAGFRLSAATFVAGLAAALVMIGANADDTQPSAGVDTAPVVLSIGR